MSRMILVRSAPAPAEYLRSRVVTKDDFGITYVRWPYDPAVSTGGELTSTNASRWQTELDGSIGWIRTFDPSIYGRYQGGTFVQVGTSTEGSPRPYGRIEGGQWYQGMLRRDGTYDWSKLDLLITSARAKGLKIMQMIGSQGAYYDSVNTRYVEYPLPTGEFWSVNPTAFQNRFRDFMAAYLERAGNNVAAIEIANEPERWVRLNTVVAAGFTEMLACMVRITKQLVQARGLSVLVCSPPFQGGETGELTAFLGTSAEGISINGVNGAGTYARDWIDVVCHHNYGNFADRAAGGDASALDAAGINDAAADAAYPNNTTFADMFAKATAVKTAARVGGWTGRLWNSEFHATGIVGTGAWYPRKMTATGFARLYRQCLHASLIGGYEKCFIYAPDHPTLGMYDDNVGTVPAGEPAEWWFKSPDNTARGATALAAAIQSVVGQYVGGRTNGDPFFSRNGDRPMRSTTGTAGVFTEI